MTSTYFTECQWSISMKIIIFQGSRGASTFFQGGGGVQLFLGGSNCLFPAESHITCVFPGGSDPPPPPPPTHPPPPPHPPPLDQRMQYLDQLDAVTKVRYEKEKVINLIPPPPPPPPWVSLNVYMVSGKTTIVA